MTNYYNCDPEYCTQKSTDGPRLSILSLPKKPGTQPNTRLENVQLVCELGILTAPALPCWEPCLEPCWDLQNRVEDR